MITAISLEIVTKKRSEWVHGLLFDVKCCVLQKSKAIKHLINEERKSKAGPKKGISPPLPNAPPPPLIETTSHTCVLVYTIFYILSHLSVNSIRPLILLICGVRISKTCLYNSFFLFSSKSAGIIGSGLL